MSGLVPAFLRLLGGPVFTIRVADDSAEADVAAGDTVYAVKKPPQPGQAVILSGAGGKPTAGRLAPDETPPPTLGVIVAVVTPIGPKKGGV